MNRMKYVAPLLLALIARSPGKVVIEGLSPLQVITLATLKRKQGCPFGTAPL